MVAPAPPRGQTVGMADARRSIDHYELRARIAKALAHPGRLMILDVLGERGEASAAELTELLEVDQSTMSRHLSLLKQVGLVSAERRGGLLRYRVRVTCLDGFWQCVEGVLAEQAAVHEDALAPAGARVALVRVETLQPAKKKKRGAT